MASEREQFIKEIAGGFDEERKILMPPNSWIALLAPGQDSPFDQLRYYTKGFITRSNNFRTGFYVEIATIENLLSDIQNCSHFAVNGICYATGEGDTFPPSGDRLTWMIYGTHVRDVYEPSV